MASQKNLLLASAGVLSILAAGPVYAQESQNTEDTIVVTGIRGSLRSSIEQKRNSTAIVEVVTAEDIGDFPDKNVADSLGRITGLNVVTGSAAAGGFGENERVSIRGTDPNLNLTLLNGHGIATGDWFVLDQQNGGRSFNFSMLPSEIVGSLQVYKSSQADLPEGGVGGTVDVHTRMPLDLEQTVFQVSAQELYASRAGEWSPQVSGMASWHNASNTFGVLVGGFYEEREFRRDGQELLGYNVATNFAGTGQDVLYPTLIGNAFFTQTRTREGGNIVLQWRPSDTLEFALSGLYTHMDADNVNVNHMAWVSNAIGNATGPIGAPGSALTAYTINDGVLTSATWANTTVGGTPVNGLVQDDIFRTAFSEASDINLSGTWSPNERLTLRGDIGYTKGEGTTDDTYAWETYWQTGLSYTLGTPITTVSYSGIPSDPTSAAYLDNFYSWSWGGHIESPDEETYGRIDAEFAVDSGWIKSWNFGARYTDHTREVNYVAYAWPGNGLYSGTSTIDLGAVFAGATTPSDYFEDLGGGAQRYALADRNKVLAQLATNGGRTFAFYPPLSFSVEEKTQAYYAMARLDGGSWRGNAGVRAVHTDQETTQYSAQAPTTVSNIFGSWGAVNVDRDYWDILPSVTLAYDASDDVVVRLSAAKVMSRPGYAQLAGAFSVNDLTLTGTAGGNPELDPFRAWQFNAAAEWYYGADALLSVGVFYLDIDSYITQRPFTLHAETQQHPAPAGADFRMTGPVNGDGGTNRGFEISLQQPLGGGFGFIVNYTYADAKTDLGAPIDGNSKNTYNLVGYFENDLLSTRVAYNFRSAFKAGVDRSTDMWQDDYATLDASANFNITPHLSLTFDAQNLTDEKLFYYVGTPSIPRAYYDNGQTFFMGVRFRN
ncbi:MAG TPA: TonB-dependent receptor [Caulobacterales bacterium]|nr:TonB-dependent receptor [Caulobacterales bacterium]